MRYICLVYQDEESVATIPDAEHASIIREALDYQELLRENEHYIASSQLQPTSTAATIRVRGSKMAITDGPFAETKEQLGGFILIEASDLNEAIRIASRMPQARLGCIEIRALKEFGDPCGRYEQAPSNAARVGGVKLP